ncbi:MAG: hypothetical protein BWY69_01001 [Planctomycetes bacterium ADurb.Bin401]|nr:MAG: hypothetical protein BWY69_01001 [Planctomycetes bacterium ADurb.Bin401]
MPIISEILSPLCRRDIIPEIKSCTAPAKIHPKTIHRNTTGPHNAPASAPKIGPRPAMFSSWIKNIFGQLIGTKSTPSEFAIAGVGLSGKMPNTFSANLP